MSATLDTVKQRLATLVGLPSVSSVDPAIDMSNRPVVEQLANWFDALDFKVEIQPIASVGAKSNLIATLGEGDGGLVLAGHTDTVPCEPALWRFDPFELTEDHGRLYGLGTADMKCFFPIVLAALEQAGSSKLRAPLTILATADEESSMSGARQLLDCGMHLGVYGLIGEPTSLVPVSKHKGVTMIRIALVGQSGHSSDPSLGNNALDGMQQVLNALDGWREGLNLRFEDPAFKVPSPTVNFGSIRGGDNPNRICGACELQVDIRVLPGMDIKVAVDELSEIVHATASKRGLKAEIQELMSGIDAFQSVPGSAAVSLAESLSGTRAGSIAFATEAPFLSQMGIDTVVLGPGHVAQAHQPDEYVEISGVTKMIDIVDGFIRKFCRHE